MMNRCSLLLCLFLLPYFDALAQKTLTDSVHTLKTAEVSGFRFSDHIVGVKKEEQDSNTLRTFENYSVGELLSQRSSLYVKSNGVSGMTSVSIRGTGTSHTAVLWNGFNLQNPMNGGMDFSLLPVSFTNKITIQYNGMSSLYGSGAIGGTIQLANIPEFDKGLAASVGFVYGSFSNYTGNILLDWSNKKATFSLKTIYHEGKNDFPYTNTASFGFPKEKQIHAELKQYAVMFDNANKINDKNFLTFRLWVQTADRNLPPLMTQDTSDAEQADETYRTALEWKNIGRNYKLFIRSALFVEDYRYKEMSKLINSTSRSISSINEAELYYRIFPFQTINVGLHYKYMTGNTDFYQNQQDQQEIALFVSYLLSNRKDNWKMNVSIRQEFTNERFVPILPSFGMDVRLHKELFVYMNFSRNFRIPTLNDYYWYPGGNPDLKPEDGFAEEIGIKHLLKGDRTQFNYTVSMFNNNVENWIVWLPSGTYWSPQNIQSVWSRGAEASFRFDYSVGKILFDMSGKVCYAKATVRKSNNESAIDKQLLYTPELNANIILGLGYKSYLFSYNMTYVSASYTTVDNLEKIDHYMLGDIQISKEFKLEKISISAFVHVNNIWNQTYQTIAWQAMPGINFKTGIKINLKHKPNK